MSDPMNLFEAVQNWTEELPNSLSGLPHMVLVVPDSDQVYTQVGKACIIAAYNRTDPLEVAPKFLHLARFAAPEKLMEVVGLLCLQVAAESSDRKTVGQTFLQRLALLPYQTS